MMANNDQTVYEQIGEDGFNRLVAAFYQHVAENELLSVLYPKEDFSGAERRLRMFLIQFFGGSQQYSSERGHPRLRMRHMPFSIGPAQRDAWMTTMQSALDEAAIPEPAYSTMKSYFENTATFLMNMP
jgi:hemoglobin